MKNLSPRSEAIAAQVIERVKHYQEGAITSPELLLNLETDITNWLTEIVAENAAVVEDGERRLEVLRDDKGFPTWPTQKRRS